MTPIQHRPSTLARTVCKHGHAWIPQNLRTDRRGYLYCRLCNSAACKRHYAAIKLADAQLRGTQIN